MDIHKVPFEAYFPYIHPKDADALALTNKQNNVIVDKEYKRAGWRAVMPGGCWHHKLCKRARESVQPSLANTMPKALASLVDQKCIVCKKRSMSSVSMWGFIAHKPCIRHLLLNTYYIHSKWGLVSKDLKTLPKERLTGYRILAREPYDYDVVFRQPFLRFVPREWTLKYIVTELHVDKVALHCQKKRKAQQEYQALKEQKRQKTNARDQKRQEAVARRRATLEAHPSYPMVHRVLTLVGNAVMDDYLTHVVRCKTTLAKVISKAEKYDLLLRTLHPDDIIGADLKHDAQTLVRGHVTSVLNEMVTLVQRRYTKPPSKNVANKKSMNSSPCISCSHRLRAKDCKNAMCGKCCRGCSRHVSQMY